MQRCVVVAWTLVWQLGMVPAGACLLIAGAGAVTGRAVAQSEAGNETAARDAFERGRVFYDSGQFEQASIAFEEAYRLSGRDALLYNMYLAYRDANEQRKAAEALRGFLAKVANIENRAQLEARLAALDAGLARQQQEQADRADATSGVTSSAAPASAERAPPAALQADARQHPLRFYAGISLAAVGGAAVLTSIATGVLASKRQSELEDGCSDRVCSPGLADTADSGKRLAHTTDVLLFGGIALAGAGAALLVFGGGLERAKAASAQVPRVRASCSREGCSATTTLWF